MTPRRTAGYYRIEDEMELLERLLIEAEHERELGWVIVIAYQPNPDLPAGTVGYGLPLYGPTAERKDSPSPEVELMVASREVAEARAFEPSPYQQLKAVERYRREARA